MSQSNFTQPASAGPPENVLNLRDYHPQFSANTQITEQQQKEGLRKMEEKTMYLGQVGNLYFPKLNQETVYAGGQQAQSSVHNVKTQQAVTTSLFLPGTLAQTHTHHAPTQQHNDPSVPAPSLMVGQSQVSVGPSFVSNVSAVFPGTVTGQVGTTNLPSVLASQAVQGIETHPTVLSTTNKWQTEQLRPYLSGSQNQAGMAASRSSAASNRIIVQQDSTQTQTTEISLSAPQAISSYNLIQQGLTANPMYCQGSISSVGPLPHTQSQFLPKSAPSFSANSVQTFSQAGRGISSLQMQAFLPGHSYSEGGKRKSSSPGNDEDLLQYGSKQSRTASRTVWDISRVSSDGSAPLTTAEVLTKSSHPVDSSTSTAVSTSADSTSGFMDTFRSFVESSRHGVYSQQNTNEAQTTKPVAHNNPVSTFTNKDNMSQSKASATSAFADECGLHEGNFENLKEDTAQPQRQSFVEKMHATIFSLSEEVSSSASGSDSGQQPSLTMSSSSLASILKRVGRLDGGQDTHTDSCTPRNVDDRKSLSPPLHSPQETVKLEPAEDSASASSHQFKTSDASLTSSSDSESETSSTNSKKRSKSSGMNAASKKMKMEDSGKVKSVPLSSTNPCVSGSRKKKQGKGSKQASKGSTWAKPLVKVSLATLKRTGAPFLQHGPCTDLPPKVSKCRECRMAVTQGDKDMPSIFCRFYAFRRLRYHPAKGTMMKAGFSELSDADPDHIEPWLPKFPIEEPQLDQEMAKFILSKVGDKFCELVQQEKEAMSLPGMDTTAVWKRAVTGVREMCDVCETTIFNMHWVCAKCGYVVCLDCYKAKIFSTESDSKQEGGSRKWQICTSSRYPHDASKLILTQIIPSDALWELGRMIHDIRRKWSISAACPCGQNSPDDQAAGKTDSSQTSAKKVLNGAGEEGSSGKSKTALAQKGDPGAQNGGSKPAKGAEQSKGIKTEGTSGVTVKQEGGQGGGQRLGGCTSLRELLTKTAGKGKVALEKKPKPTGSSLNDIIQSVVEKSCRDLDTSTHTFKFLHYIPRLGQWTRELPIVTHSLTETSVLYPDVPHSWLCDGRLLRLHDPRHKGNLQIFQEQWKRGQPVMVSCVHKLMKEEQWRPEAFSRQFGHKENDLVNCHNGDIIADRPMRDFWDGFEAIENRLVDENGRDMMLKLKDWPPGDDFAELLPSYFDDLMAALPLPEYTQRDGKLNLASRLPEFLVRPDLGPKMYNAFGSAMFPKEGTTNLHLDISDAVNVLMYVGVPYDGPCGKKEHVDAAVKAIDEAGCDSITKRRIREVHELPGALWQIFDAHDADKIRDFLNKVAKERGEEIEPNHDAIHDQSWYLDEILRDRLLKEYGVQGYTIVQCLGDSIFIPAGAPHQVRNLHSCIKVAEDFVSPEHLNHCFRLTQEFRQLSETHSNHEDKLQVKNIIYHAVKDSIAVLRDLEPEDNQ